MARREPIIAEPTHQASVSSASSDTVIDTEDVSLHPQRLSSKTRPESKLNKFTEHVRTIGSEIRNMSEPVRRLIIEKVTLRNFKSYGGITTIGPFHKRFTSIVGPNGSGKSNVIDSILFVFGFRAKQMRFDKLSELIHNSSFYVNANGGRPLESMEVSIHFCEILDRDPDVDDYEVIEGSQLVISREVLLDNTSKYRINGVVSTQKQVGNALKAYGIDLYNNRFLILQGEVEQISQMKPKATKPDEEGLLEYLEEIIGTNQYVPQIKEAQLAYDEIQDQCQQQNNRTMVVQRDLEELQQAKDEADEYINKERILHKTAFLLMNKQIHQSKLELNDANILLEDLESKLKKGDEEIFEVLRDKDEIIGKIKQTEAEIAKLASKQRTLSERFQKMCNKDEDLRAQLLREVKKVEEKTASIKKLQMKKPQYDRNSKEKLEKCEELMKSIPNVQEELERAENELDRLTDKFKSEMDNASEQLRISEQRLAPIQQSFDECGKEIKEIETSIALLESSKKELTSQLTSLRRDEQTLRGSIQENERKVKDMEVELKRIRSFDATRILELEKVVQERAEECMKCRGEYESAKREFDEMANDKNEYKYLMSVLPKMKGVHGRLGDLCTIGQQYEKAFMASCGSFLETLVVDTPDIASQIFEELRKRNMGRISAIALSVLNNDLKKLMDRVLSAPPDVPQGIERLVDLVQPNNPKYKICFFYALRETMVAPTLDQATTVGYNLRKRVVTMDGEIIEPDGRLSGGGLNLQRISKKKQTRPISDKIIDASTLGKMKEDLEAITNELNKLKNDLATLRQQEQTLLKQGDKLSYELELLKQTVDNETLQVNDIVDGAKRLQGKLLGIQDDKRLNELSEELNIKRKESANIEAKIKEQEVVVNRAYKALENVGEGKLKIAKLTVSELEDKLAKIRKSVEQLRKDAANLLGDSERCTKDIAKFERDIEDHRNREKELESQLDALEEEAADVSKQLLEINKEYEELMKLLTELNVTLTSRNKTIQEHELKSIDIKHNIDELRKRSGTLQQILNSYQNNLDNLTSLHKGTVNLINISRKSSSALSLHTLSGKSHCEVPDIAENGEIDYNADLSFNDEELHTFSTQALNKRIEELKHELGNPPNLGVIEEFETKVNDYVNKKYELQTLQNKRNEAKHTHDQLCFKRKSEFLINFAIIANKLKEMYQTITLGGDAELELVDSMEPFTEGILFSVRPVNKSWKQIYNLSGGEKTLSSLALVFALHHYKPNPVYFMDEIDAALDFRNVSIIAQNIKERTKDAQFIIISLRNQMFELCNQMVGIYKTWDVTKSVSIIPAAYDTTKRQLENGDKQQ